MRRCWACLPVGVISASTLWDREFSAVICLAGVCGAFEEGVFKTAHVKRVLGIRGNLNDLGHWQVWLQPQNNAHSFRGERNCSWRRGARIAHVKNVLFGGSLPSLLRSVVNVAGGIPQGVQTGHSLGGKIVLDFYNEPVMRSSLCSGCDVPSQLRLWVPWAHAPNAGKIGKLRQTVQLWERSELLTPKMLWKAYERLWNILFSKEQPVFKYYRNMQGISLGLGRTV